MNKLITVVAVALAFGAGPAFSQTTNANSTSSTLSGAQSGAAAQTGAITFQSSAVPDNTRISTTPNVYAPPSMFGGANNCGMSNTLGVGFTGFGIGGSIASESKDCNAREDTSIAYKLGYKDVADMRFFCFGEDVNRMAFEATGHKCPANATAKGLPNQHVAAAQANRNVALITTTDENQQARIKSGYTGNDPIVMKRLGIIR